MSCVMLLHIKILSFLSIFFLFSCMKTRIDGVLIRDFDSKREYFKEGRYHAYGRENRKKSIPAAKYYLKEALKIDPADHVTVDLLGSLYRNSGKPDIEEKLYLHSLKKGPSNVRLRYSLGRFYLSQKKYKKATNTFKKCISQKNKTPFFPCYSMLATAYTRNNQIDRALKTYKAQIKYYKTDTKILPGKRLSTNPGLGTIHVKMAELYLSKMDFDSALKNSSKAQALIPRNWPAYKEASKIISKIEHEINKKEKQTVKSSRYSRKRKTIIRRRKNRR